jgi:hypothetical protein
MLSVYRPRQNGVVYTTPTPQEQEKCRVELLKGADGSSASGWLLRDPQGRPLRRFFDSNGDRHIDVWSYYLEGVEVYRERSTKFDKVVDEYRWLNTGGMKCGVSTKGDGKIDFWRMISAEEVSQEILQAIVNKDSDRLKALWITDTEIKALELPDAEVARLRELQAQAQNKFMATANKLALTAQVHWERLEASTPQCLPADSSGSKRDMIKYLRSTILYEHNGKHDWLQTGEMIQVGLAWRLVDAPVPGMPTEGTSNETVAGAGDPALQPLIEELRRLDADAPKVSDATPTANPAVARYHLQRATLLQKLLAKVSKSEDRDSWVRQVADSLSAAAQASSPEDKTAYNRLVELAQQTVKAQPGSALAAYVTFREMSADYAAKLAKVGPDFAKIQEAWLVRLAKFVQDYPSAEDTPDALLQLGMVSEFLGKEIEAKKWYQQLAMNFADKKPLSEKAAGALRRLDIEGKNFELAGATVDGKSFDCSSLRGKVIVVYYWASYTQQSVGDFARFKVLLNSYAGKGVELVSINLDSAPPEAGAPDRSTIPGIQLAHSAGLDSPLATQYGIMALPTMFLVNKDGKVVSRTVQLATLEEEIKKLLK